MTDLVAWRESFMRRIQEIRKNEPDREIVYTDETWLNAGHRIKKEWVDLEALQNPRRSIADFISNRWLHEGFDGKREASNNCRLYH